MDLWIRSQDRKDLIKVNDIFINRNNDCLICCNYTMFDSYNDYFSELGVYDTKERALEVLDEIQDLLQNAYVGNLERIVYKMPIE